VPSPKERIIQTRRDFRLTGESPAKVFKGLLT
jgi:hypothetical protein